MILLAIWRSLAFCPSIISSKREKIASLSIFFLLSFFLKKTAHQIGCFGLQNAGNDFKSVDRVLLRKNIDPTAIRANSYIGSRPDEPIDPGREDRPCAHAARLQGAIKGRFFKAPVAKMGRAGSHAEHLCVSGRVLQKLYLIVAASDDLVILNKDCPDGNLVSLKGLFRLFESLFHKMDISLKRRALGKID